jgi:hypothetical protein
MKNQDPTIAPRRARASKSTTERLDAELAAARQLIAVFQEQLHRSQEEADRWREIAERLIMVLSEPPVDLSPKNWLRLRRSQTRSGLEGACASPLEPPQQR